MTKVKELVPAMETWSVAVPGRPDQPVLIYWGVGNVPPILRSPEPGKVVFQHHGTQFDAERSDDVLFLQKVEDYFRSLGHAIRYPTVEEHAWVAPWQYEKPALPEWKQFHFWYDDSTVRADRYYGFEDFGMHGAAEGGYDSPQAAIAALPIDVDRALVGTTREELGTKQVVVTTGREYLQWLHDINDEGYPAVGEIKE